MDSTTSGKFDPSRGDRYGLLANNILAILQVTHLSPFVSMAALVLVGACTNEFDGLLQGYLTDSYPAYAASANAPLAVLRGILSGSFPIFAETFFSGLGANVAASILAAIATLYCGVAIWFWKRAVQIREASHFAASTLDEAET